MIISLANKVIKEFLNRVIIGSALEKKEAEMAFEVVLSGNATPAQVGALLAALRIRGESVLEITSAARVLRTKSTRFESDQGATVLDMCGTGGDMQGTYNISTATAFIIAGCGVQIIKHGNSASSSQSGSSDVLKALGINVDTSPYRMQEALLRSGVCFLMAPRYHNVMQYITLTRSELATRTIFNFLGPLSNPAGACYQVVGVFSAKWIQPIAEVLGRLGTKRAWVVHGRDGLDEITTTNETDVAEYQDGIVKVFTMSPKLSGFITAHPRDLRGGDAAYNASAIWKLLNGKLGPFRDIVLLNSAVSLILVGKADSLDSAVKTASSAIDSGRALETLEKLVTITRY